MIPLWQALRLELAHRAGNGLPSPTVVKRPQTPAEVVVLARQVLSAGLKPFS